MRLVLVSLVISAEASRGPGLPFSLQLHSATLLAPETASSKSRVGPPHSQATSQSQSCFLPASVSSLGPEAC